MNSPLNLIRSMSWASFVLVVASGIFPFPASARAEVLALYRAPGNPLTSSEGTRWAAAGRTTAGAAVEQPEPAWRIAPQAGNALSYSLMDPESVLQSAFAMGWKLTARFRLDPTVASPTERFVASLGMENADKKEAFVFSARTAEGTGELFVEINKKTVPLPDLAPDAFHTYVMTYDPKSSTVELSVDGHAIPEAFPPAKTDRWFLRWGHSSISPRGAVEWASVVFESLPAQP
jgi:hypothetical protein